MYDSGKYKHDIMRNHCLFSFYLVNIVNDDEEIEDNNHLIYKGKFIVI